MLLSALARERFCGWWAARARLTDGRVYSTSYVFDPSGSCVARHRKCTSLTSTYPAASRFQGVRHPVPPLDVTVFGTP